MTEEVNEQIYEDKCLFHAFFIMDSIVPAVYCAESELSSNDQEPIEVVLFAEQPDGEIEVFEDETAADPLVTIPDDTTVELVHSNESFHSLATLFNLIRGILLLQKLCGQDMFGILISLAVLMRNIFEKTDKTLISS